MARQQYRVQAPELQGPVPLQPPRLPSDTYAPPARPIQDDRLARLADALGAFNSSLQGFGSAAAAAQKKQQHEIDMNVANKTIAGLSREEYLDLVNKNQLPALADPFAVAALQKHAGQVYADQTAEGIHADIKTGKIDLAHPETDIDKILGLRVQQDLSQFPLSNSSAATGGYRGRVEALRDALLNQQATKRAEAFVQQQNSLAYEQFNRIFDVFAGADPKITQNFVRRMYKDIGPGSPANIPTRALDDQLLTIVKNRAADPSTVDSALEVLSADRVGQDGSAVPPLGRKPDYVKDVAEIEKIAKNTISRRFDAEQNANAIRVAGSSLQRQDGSFWSLKDTSYTNPITGERKVINAAEAKKAAVTDFLTFSERQAAERGETPLVRFEREFGVLQNADVPNPSWKETLEGAAKALTNPQALTDPVQRNNAMAAAELYQNIATRNHPYLKGTLKLDKTSQDFYTVYDVARNQMGLNDDRALDMASQAIRTSDNENDLHVRQAKAREVADKVAGANFANWYNNFFGGNTENQGVVQKRVMDIASVLTRVPGVTTDQAIERALEMVKQRSLFINGQVVPDNGFLPPPEMKGNIERYLDIFAKQHGKENGVKNGSELSIEPFGGTNFRIVKRDNGFTEPLYVRDGNGQVTAAVISMSMLQQMKEQDEGTKAQKIEERSQERIKEQQRGESQYLPHIILRDTFRKLFDK